MRSVIVVVALSLMVVGTFSLPTDWSHDHEEDHAHIVRVKDLPTPQFSKERLDDVIRYVQLLEVYFTSLRMILLHYLLLSVLNISSYFQMSDMHCCIIHSLSL